MVVKSQLFFISIMGTLYNQLADVYEKMYRSFINYEEEFTYYSRKLKMQGVNCVLELGCGTGNLAEKFIESGFTYTGMDLSNTMLDIAKKKFPDGKFILGNMLDFSLSEKHEACFFAGRTSAYLIGEKDIKITLSAINKNLCSSGIICFDCIDAEKFLPQIKDGFQISHTAGFEEKTFHRDSYWKSQPELPGLFNWKSIYFEIEKNGSKKEIGSDDSMLRAFTKQEIELVLQKTGYKLIEMEDRPSYAFDTFVILAQKIM